MLKGIIYYLSLSVCAVITFVVLYQMGTGYENEYDCAKKSISVYAHDIPAYTVTGLTGEYALIKSGEDRDCDMFDDTTYAALLIDNTDNNCIVSYNVHNRIYPASMTKFMTAIVVCDAIESGQISMDDEITLTHKIDFNDPAAMHSGLDTGYTITVRNLLYGLLIKSYNDYCVILAEYVAGSEEAFVQMMNEKAYEICATNSHFMNPHGLHDDNHYVTAYDMYLIAREANRHEIINDINSLTMYSYTYRDANGVDVPVDITPTNAFLSDRAYLPSNIEINNWKTGTTKMAGYCMTMQVTIAEKSYTIVVADSESSEDLYNLITIMFNLTQ